MLNHIGLHSKTVAAVASALNFCVNDYLEQSWEESIYPGFDLLQNIGPLCNRKDQSSEEYFSSIVGGQVEFDLRKLMRHIENSLASIVQMSIKIGNTNEKIEDFDDGDTILEENSGNSNEKSEWVSEELPAGATVLIGSSENVIDMQELSTPRVTKNLEQVHEIDEQDSIEPKIEDDFIL